MQAVDAYNVNKLKYIYQFTLCYKNAVVFLRSTIYIFWRIY